jgi:zinc transporter 2
VIVSASIIYFVVGDDKEWSAWQLADPFCTYLFSVVALYSTISILKESMVLLMDGCEDPQLIDKTNEFVKTLKNEYPNIEIEGLRVWSSNRGKSYLAMKVIMKTGLSQGGELGEESSMLKQQNMHDAIYERVKGFSK